LDTVENARIFFKSYFKAMAPALTADCGRMFRIRKQCSRIPGVIKRASIRAAPIS